MIGPTEDRVVILPEAPFVARPSGVITATQQQDANIGVVVMVGPGRITEQGQLIPVPLKTGWRVAYTRFGGMRLEHRGETYLILGVHDIVAIVEDDVPMPQVTPIEGGVDVHFGDPREIAAAQRNGDGDR